MIEAHQLIATSLKVLQVQTTSLKVHAFDMLQVEATSLKVHAFDML